MDEKRYNNSVDRQHCDCNGSQPRISVPSCMAIVYAPNWELWSAFPCLFDRGAIMALVIRVVKMHLLGQWENQLKSIEDLGDKHDCRSSNPRSFLGKRFCRHCPGSSSTVLPRFTKSLIRGWLHNCSRFGTLCESWAIHMLTANANCETC